MHVLSYITHEYAMKRFEKGSSGPNQADIQFFYPLFRSGFRLYPLWVLSRFRLAGDLFVTQNEDRGLRKADD